MPSAIRNKLRVLALCCAALAALWALAPAVHAAVSVEMTVDPQEVYLGESADLTVTVSGTNDTGEPSLENLGDFSVQGKGASSRISIVNGAFSRSKTYNYELVPRRTGSFTLGPAAVSVDGAVMRSNTVVITVSRAPSAAGKEDAGPVFATAQLSSDSAYPGQEILYKLSVYHSEPLADRVTLTLPEVPGLTFTPLSEPGNHTAVIRGVRYGLIEATYTVSAQKTGDYQIPPARMDVPIVVGQRRNGSPQGSPSVDFFGFSWRQKRVLPVFTKELALTVLPFPEQGRPADFGGLVGRFSLSAQVSPARIRANESATLTVKVTGQGNVRAIPDLALPRTDALKVYPDNPLFEENQGVNGSTGEKTMKWALVPQAAGAVDIPAFTLCFFDPKDREYKTVSTPVLQLAVDPDGSPQAAASPAPAGPARPADKKQVEVLGQDIQTIHESLSGLGQAGAQKPGPVLLALLVLPVAVWLCCLVANWLSARSETLARTLGARKALPAFEKTVRGLGDEDAEGLWKACLAYVGARLLLPGTGLTQAEAAQKLIRAGADPREAERFGAILAGLEARVFASGKASSVKKEKDEVLSLVRAMEKRLP